MRLFGTVKWYRLSDRTGYIDGDDGVKRYIDYGSLADDTDEVLARDRVSFLAETVIDRECAYDVSLV